MAGSSDGNSNSSKKTKNSGIWKNFKQQTCDAWVPRYTASGISPWLISYGVVLIPLGILMLIFSSDTSTEIKKINVDYTHCPSVQNKSQTCADYVRSPASWEDDALICECEVEFLLSKPIKGDKLYMYYTLENFHQNVRKYTSSRDDEQLLGKIGTVDNPYTPSKDCKPYDKDPDGKPIYPCGAIANSMFNDSIQLYYNRKDAGLVKIEQGRRGISWHTDLKHRYKNPVEFYNPGHPIWDKYAKPRDWKRTIWDLDPEDPENNGVQNEDLMVWMRPATFSSFQKLYRIITPSSQANVLGDDGLPAGNYLLKINYTYEVTSFNGKKGITLLTTTVFGQQNLFQGISFVSMGGISMILGLLFLLCGCNNRLGKGLRRYKAGRDFKWKKKRRHNIRYFSLLSVLKLFIFVTGISITCLLVYFLS